MVAVGRAAHPRYREIPSFPTPKWVAVHSATHFGVESSFGRVANRRCAARPTSTICDRFTVDLPGCRINEFLRGSKCG